MKVLLKKCRNNKRLNSDKANAISFNNHEVYFYSVKFCEFEETNDPHIYSLDIPDWMYEKMDWKQRLDLELINKEAKDELQGS